MTAPRKFYKTVFSVTVLTEEPYEARNLKQIYYDITSGEASGQVSLEMELVLTGAEMAKALLEQRSDPEFFRLDEHGNDLDSPEVQP